MKTRLKAKGQRLKVGKKRTIRFPSSFGPRPSSLSSTASLVPWPLALGLIWAQVDIGKKFWFQGDIPAETAFPFAGGINAYVSAILPNVYVVAGLFLFGLILFGGFQYITGAGDEEKLKKGKAVLTSALLGFAILFGSFWIIQIIQVLTGVPILSPSI